MDYFYKDQIILMAYRRGYDSFVVETTTDYYVSPFLNIPKELIDFIDKNEIYIKNNLGEYIKNNLGEYISNKGVIFTHYNYYISDNGDKYVLLCYYSDTMGEYNDIKIKNDEFEKKFIRAFQSENLNFIDEL